MLIKTILNKIEKFKSFIYGKVRLERMNGTEALIVEVKARQNTKGICPKCGKRRPAYVHSLCVFLNMCRCGAFRYTSGMLLVGRTVGVTEYWWKSCLGLRGKSI